MQSLVVVVALLGCSIVSAQYITRGVGQVRSQGLVGGHPGLVGHPGLLGGGYGQFAGQARYISGQPGGYYGGQQFYNGNQYQHHHLSGIPNSLQYQIPSHLQYNSPAVGGYYSSPVQQFGAAVRQFPAHQYSAHTAGHAVQQAPIQYAQSRTAAAVRTPAILRQSQDVSHDGSYNFGFESEDGIAVQSAGSVKALGPQESGQVAQGSYSYVAPDGTPITTTWYADETGFHAEGAHLPQAPTGHTRTY